MSWRDAAELAFLSACGALLIGLILTSHTLAAMIHAAGVCR